MDAKSVWKIFMIKLCLLPLHRFQWEMKISKWCSSSTSSRWWCLSASLSRHPCLSTTVSSHLRNRIAQGEHVSSHQSDDTKTHQLIIWQVQLLLISLYLNAVIEKSNTLKLEKMLKCLWNYNIVSLLFFHVPQSISRLFAAPQLWAVSDHTITVPLQPSTVAAAIYRFDLLSCTL